MVKTELTESKVATAAAVSVKGGGEQVIGREGETATFIWRCLFNSELRVIGFAPRQFNRSAFRVAIDGSCQHDLIL